MLLNVHKHLLYDIYNIDSMNLHLTASLRDNANLAHAGMARAAPARGLTELFLISYFALLYAQTGMDPPGGVGGWAPPNWGSDPSWGCWGGGNFYKNV